MSRTNALLSRFSRDEIYSHVSPSNKYPDQRAQSLDTSLKSSKKAISRYFNEGQQPTRPRLPLNEIVASQLSYCNNFSQPSSTKSCSYPNPTYKQIFENKQIKKSEDPNSLETQAANHEPQHQTSKNQLNPSLSSSAYFKSLKSTQQSQENLEYIKKIQAQKYSDNYQNTYLQKYYNSTNTTAATTNSNSKKNLSKQPSSRRLLSKLDINYAKNYYHNTQQSSQSDSQKMMLLNSSFHSEQNKENRLEDSNKISWSDQAIKQKSQQESYSQWLSPLPISIMTKESQVWRENKNYRDLVAFSNTSTSLQHSHRQKEQARKASYDFGGGDQKNLKNHPQKDRDLEKEEKILNLRQFGAENVKISENRNADHNKMKSDILSNTYDYNSYLSNKNNQYSRENEVKDNKTNTSSNSSYLNSSFMKVQNSSNKNASNNNNNYFNSFIYQNQGSSFGAIAPATKEIKAHSKSYYDDYKGITNHHESSKNSFERSSDLILNRKESKLAYSQKKYPSSSTPKNNSSENSVVQRQKQEEKQLMQLQQQSIKKKKDPNQDSPFMHRHYQSIHKANNNQTKKVIGNDTSPDNATFRQKRASTVSFFGVSGAKSADKYDDCDFMSGKKTAREVPFGDLCSSQECIRPDAGLENEHEIKAISLSFNQIELENQREAEKQREISLFRANHRIDSNSNSKFNNTNGNESFFSNSFLEEKDWNSSKNNNKNMNVNKQSFCSNQSNGDNTNGISNNDNDTSRFMMSSSVMDCQKKHNNINGNVKTSNSSFMQEMECSMQLFEKLSQAAEEKGKLLERNRELERQLDEEKRKQQVLNGYKDTELVIRQIAEASIEKLQEQNDLLNKLLKEKLTAIISLEEALKRKDNELKSSQYESKRILDKILKENSQLKESFELVRIDKISMSEKLQKLTDNLNEIEAIRKENADLSVSFQEIYSENEKTLEIQKEKEQQFKKELAEKDLQIQRRDSLILELQGQIRELNSVIKEQKQKITDVEEKNETQNKNQIREFKDKIREQEEKIREFNLQIAQQTIQIKEFEAIGLESNNKRKQYEAHAREQQTWRNKAEELENKCQEIDKSYDYLLAEYNRQKSELSICKQKEIAYVEQYQQEVSGMKQTNLEFQAILNRQVQEINYYKMQVQNLPKQNEHIIDDLNNKLVHLLAENQRLNTIIFQRCKNTWN